MKNKKLIVGIVVIFALIVCAVIFFFCTKKEYSYHLTMTESTWGEYEKSDSKVKEIDIKKDDTIYSNELGEKLSFKIIEASSESITIKTSQPMSLRKNENEGIDLNSKETEFILKKGETIILSILAMDGGVNYKFN